MPPVQTLQLCNKYEMPYTDGVYPDYCSLTIRYTAHSLTTLHLYNTLVDSLTPDKCEYGTRSHDTVYRRHLVMLL